MNERTNHIDKLAIIGRRNIYVLQSNGQWDGHFHVMEIISKTFAPPYGWSIYGKRAKLWVHINKMVIFWAADDRERKGMGRFVD